MRTLIFEGIASTGKTTIENELIKLLNANNISNTHISEDITLMPLLDNLDPKISIEFLNNILDKIYRQDDQIVIFDRLFFTHIIITNSNIETFKQIEDKLILFNPTLVFLKIEESKIPERIRWAMEHRDSKWLEHVRAKGTDEEIFAYYKNQQQKIASLVNQTSIPTITFNTTNLDFEKVAREIFEIL